MNATSIDWDLVNSLDPIQIKQSKDSKSIHAIIKSINSCYISSDQTVFSNNPLTPRLIQLLQISIQYLMSFQKHLSKTIENKNKDIASLQKKYKKIEQAYRQLITINDNLRKPREVCPTCGKKFKIGYLDRHFQSRHPELIVPWAQIRSKSSYYNPHHDKAIIDEISAIQQAKERKNKLEINKGNIVQISPKKENKKDTNSQQQQNDEQISLNQGQLDQMVDEISKRVSERIQIDKNSSLNNIDSLKSSQKKQSKKTVQKSNSVPSQQLEQFTVDARRHDQSLNHQHYIQQNIGNDYIETDYTRENKENPNISNNSLKKISGNRVVFDPSVIENHCDTRRRTRNMDDANDYDDDDYNDDYNNEGIENFNYNYDNQQFNNDRNRQTENSINKNEQKDEISANELDDFIMGSSDVAISNHQSKPKQTKTQQNQQLQKNQTNSTQNQKNLQNSQNNIDNDYQNELDEFIVDSSEIAASNRQNNQVPKNQTKMQQQQQQQIKQQNQDLEDNYNYEKSSSQNKNNDDFHDDFDEFMIESGESSHENLSQKQKQQPKQQQIQTIQKQQTKPQIKQNQQQNQTIQKQQSKPQIKQNPQQNQIKQTQVKQNPQQSQTKQNQINQSQIKQTQVKQNPQQNQTKQNQTNQNQIKQTQVKRNPQQKPQTAQNQQPQKPPTQKQPQPTTAHQPSPSQRTDQTSFNDDFDAYILDAPPPSAPPQTTPTRQTAIKGTPPQTRQLASSPASLQSSPAPSSSASFPPSPTTPRANRRPAVDNNENSAFEFTDGSPQPTRNTPTSSSFRRSFEDEEAAEFRDFMMQQDELPKPPKRDIQGSYVAITNDELDDLIKESSSIIDDENSKNDKVKIVKKNGHSKQNQIKRKKIPLTESQIEAMIDNDYNYKKKDDIDYGKGGQIPPQFANYSPDELDVIMAEESSALDNQPPKINYGDKSKYTNDEIGEDNDYYYYNQENNYKGDYDDDILKETNYDDKYYNEDFIDDNNFDDNYSNQNFANQNYKKDSFYDDDLRNQKKLPEKIDRPPMSIAEARKMAKKKKKSQITTIGGVEFTDSQLAGFL